MSEVQAGVELFISLCHLNVDQDKVGWKYWSRKQLNSQEIQQTNGSLLPALKEKNVTQTQLVESPPEICIKTILGSKEFTVWKLY